jgi:hypothetical protein
MKQPKYSPQEALERVKLMMKYDLSKTLNENSVGINSLMNEQINKNEVSRNDLQSKLDKVINALDSWNVNKNDLTLIRNIVKELSGKTYKGQNALDFLVKRYSVDEGGDTLIGDLDDVDTSESIEESELVDEIKSIISKTKPASTQQPVTKKPVTKTPPTKIGKGGTKTGGGYKSCSEQMPIKYGCKNETIKKVQACLGLVADGKFGPKTKQALINKSQNGDQIDSGTIIDVCKKTTPTTQSNPQPTTQTTTQSNPQTKPKFEPVDDETSDATDLLN